MISVKHLIRLLALSFHLPDFFWCFGTSFCTSWNGLCMQDLLLFFQESLRFFRQLLQRVPMGIVLCSFFCRLIRRFSLSPRFWDGVSRSALSCMIFLLFTYLGYLFIFDIFLYLFFVKYCYNTIICHFSINIITGDFLC